MTNEEITRLRALADAATPGPWKRDVSELDVFAVDRGLPQTIVSANDYGISVQQTMCDIAFIAAARTAIPALLDEIERLRATRRGIDQ